MRRSLRRLTPIFALALLVQWLAPIGAFRFVAQAIADPVAVAPLCSGMAQASEHASGSESQRHDGACCGVCAVGHGGAPLSGAASQDFALLRTPEGVIWRPAAQRPQHSRQGGQAQARAPPGLIRTNVPAGAAA